MRADLAMRHNAAVGAILGLAVGCTFASLDERPPVVGGTLPPLRSWGATAAGSFSSAENILRGAPVAMDLGPAEAITPAIALAGHGTSPPLLIDSDSALICELVRDGLDGRLNLDVDATSPDVRRAIDVARTARSAAEAIGTAPTGAIALTAALAGLRWGPAALPSTWTTDVHGLVGDRTYRVRQLRRLAERLLQLEAPVPPEPRRSLGPREVAPGLFLSNLHAVPAFVSRHPDGAVLSLCPTTGAFDSHPARREFLLHDAPGSKVNPTLAATVDEIVATIRAFHDEKRPVLVHCHHGASRTGLVLRAWLIEELGLTAEQATTEAQVRWSKTSTWNTAFNNEIARRADS